MSLFSPSIDTKHIIKQALNAKSMAYYTFTPEPEFKTAEQQKAYYEKLHRPVANETFGYRYSTPVEKIRTQAGIASKQVQDGLCLDGYSSAMVQSNIKKAKSTLKENDIISNVSKIEGDCNLKGTSLESLKDVKEITGRLLIDTKSKLKDLSSLEKITGSVWVYAKDEKEMLEFLKSSKLNLAKIAGTIVKC